MLGWRKARRDRRWRDAVGQLEAGGNAEDALLGEPETIRDGNIGRRFGLRGLTHYSTRTGWRGD